MLNHAQGRLKATAGGLRAPVNEAAFHNMFDHARGRLKATAGGLETPFKYPLRGKRQSGKAKWQSGKAK